VPNPVFQCGIDIVLTFLHLGSQEQPLVLVRTNVVGLCPESPLVHLSPFSPSWAASSQTVSPQLDYKRVIQVFCLADCQRIVGTWHVDCRLYHLWLCHPQGWLYFGSWAAYNTGSGRIYNHCSYTAGLVHWLSTMYRPYRLSMVPQLELSCCQKTYWTFRAGMDSSVYPWFQR